MNEAYSIDWHKNSLSNSKRSLEEMEAKFIRTTEQQTKSLKNLRASIEFYEEQIATAEKQGRTKFDPNRFMKKRKGSAP